MWLPLLVAASRLAGLAGRTGQAGDHPAPTPVSPHPPASAVQYSCTVHIYSSAVHCVGNYILAENSGELDLPRPPGCGRRRLALSPKFGELI